MAVTVSAKALGNMSLNSFKDRNVQKVNEEGVLGVEPEPRCGRGLGAMGALHVFLEQWMGSSL